MGIETEFFSGQPDKLDLSQTFPNPFRKSTSISFYLDEAGTVQQNIYDLRGNLFIPGNWRRIHINSQKNGFAGLIDKTPCKD